jgi:predicted PurR-regulated permease PerM
MKATVEFPFYAKISLISVGLFAFVSMLFIAQGILVPIIYATIIAIVLNPIVNFLVRRKINRIVAISLTLVLVISITILVIIFLSIQLIQFSNSFPNIVENFNQLLVQSVAWASNRLNISIIEINLWIASISKQILNTGSNAIGKTIVNTGNVVVILLLIPVYIFMILFYQRLLIEFIHRLFSVSTHSKVAEVLTATKRIIQSYLVGLLLEALIMTVLNSVCLLIIGIDYAILLGLIGAILNVIPYIGGVIAVALPMLIALATESPTHALLVLVFYLLIQFVDNNFIIPKVVASKVQINALVSIVVVLIGGALWGLPGMFLSIPLTAIVKVIFDHIEPLKPWGFLLGNIVPTTPRFTFPRQKKQILS